MKKKKKIIIIISFIIIILATTGIIIYFKFFHPYVMLTKQVAKLIDKDFKYSVECYVEGVTIRERKFSIKQVELQGEKEDDRLRGVFTDKDKSFMEVYADTKYNFVFNLKPICDYMLNKISENTIIPADKLIDDVDDTYITFQQIEEIVGLDVISMDDFGLTPETAMNLKWDLKKTDMPADIKADFNGEDTYYFELVLKDYNTIVTIGIPKSYDDEYIYVDLKKNEMRMEFYGEYRISDNVDVKIPKESISQDTVEKMKYIYQAIIWGKEGYDYFFGE